jgi:stage III sporulation protein AC
MDVNLIFKIAGIGILVAVLNILLSKSGRDEQALMITLGGLIVVLLMLVREISQRSPVKSLGDEFFLDRNEKK